MRLPLHLVIAAAVLTPGCLLANVTSGEKLRDAVEGANAEARWGRLDLATQRVHPLYREAWVAVRAEWGDEIQIAGSEVTRLRMDDDQEGAISRVEVEWYRFDTMTLQHSTLQQRWQRVDGEFALLEEELVDGDEGLLAELPEPEEEEAEGVEEDAPAATEEAVADQGGWDEPVSLKP